MITEADITKHVKDKMLPALVAIDDEIKENPLWVEYSGGWGDYMFADMPDMVDNLKNYEFDSFGSMYHEFSFCSDQINFGEEIIENYPKLKELQARMNALLAVYEKHVDKFEEMAKELAENE